MATFPPASDQVLVFLAVADHGSFSAAARHLRRAQSAVTYAIQALESDLSVVLFDRSGHRPVLTPAGEALLGNARRVAHEIAAIQRRAHGLAQGLEPELRLVVEPMFPMARLVGLLKSFNEAFPTVPIRIFVESMGAAAEKVLDRTCSIGITGPLMSDIDDIMRVPIGTSERVLVAAPNHPLGSWLGEIPFDVLGEFVQLVLTDRSALTRGKDFGVLSPLTWRLSDLGAKHAMILAGLGWGGLPRHMVEADLREKRLVQLRIAGFDSTFWSAPMPLYAVHRVDTAPGPAGRWMLERLKTLMDDEGVVDGPAVSTTKMELAAPLDRRSHRAKRARSR